MIQPEVLHKETCVNQEKVHSLYPLSIVVYGKLCDNYYDYIHKNKVKIFTFKELTRMLLLYKNWTNPFDNCKEFNEHSIFKLKYIAKVLLSKSEESLLYTSKSILNLTKNVKLSSLEMEFLNIIKENIDKYKIENNLKDQVKVGNKDGNKVGNNADETHNVGNNVGNNVDKTHNVGNNADETHNVENNADDTYKVVNNVGETYKVENNIGNNEDRPIYDSEIIEIYNNLNKNHFLCYNNTINLDLIKAFLQEKKNIKELKEDVKNLLDAIEIVFAYTSHQKKEVINWLQFLKENENERIMLKSSLDEIMKIGMYCRGWKGGKREYFVLDAPKEKEVNLISVAKKVWKSILFVNKIEGKLSEIVKIKKLPLFIYNGKTFEKSIDIFEGLTIGERLLILEEGENTSKMSSCIRMTSNWLISSSYYYLLLMGEKLPFSIDMLTHTS
jgi:hypothetical protein